MLKFFSDSLHIYLSDSKCTVIRVKRWPHLQKTLAAEVLLPKEVGACPQRFGEAFSTLLKQSGCKGLTVRIVLSDELVRFFMITPPSNVERFADCQAAAAMRFQTLFDEAPTSWKIAADWNIHRPFLACAMPRALLDALQETTSKCGLKLIEVRPQFINAYHHYRKDLGEEKWLGSISTGLLTVGMVDRHGICAVRQAFIPSNAWHDSDWLSTYLEREAMRFNMPQPKQLNLYGNLPKSGAPKKIGNLFCNWRAYPFSLITPTAKNELIESMMGQE